MVGAYSMYVGESFNLENVISQKIHIAQKHLPNQTFNISEGVLRFLQSFFRFAAVRCVRKKLIGMKKNKKKKTEKHVSIIVFRQINYVI